MTRFDCGTCWTQRCHHARETRTFDLAEGRPAGYVVASGEARVFNDPGVLVEISKVNQILPLPWLLTAPPGKSIMLLVLLSSDPKDRAVVRKEL